MENIFLKTGSIVLAAALMMCPLAAYAETAVSQSSGQEVIDPEAVDDAGAVEEAENSQKNNDLADPKASSDYLMSNEAKNIVKQTATAEHDTSLPETFDLRDNGVVTPVKYQGPWGTCWGFAAIAACETSILSATGKTYEETGLDLSEHHLTYFARTYLKDGSSQDGEGVHMFDKSTSLDTGGETFTACSLFSSGIGPIDESLIPYRGTNSKTEHFLWMNSDYAQDDNWKIPADYEFAQSYELTESSILPSPAIYNYEEVTDENDPDKREKYYAGYDASATDAIKQELMAGRGVSIAYSADTFTPDQLDSDVEPLYLNTEDNKWCHYTFDGGVPNHAVTIVGWDDTVKSTDFLDHSKDEYGDGEAHQPEGDGAWIVKNSWGSDSESFPNNYSWGIQDENGEATGYFYLSYYDRSLYEPETFQFDVEDKDDNYMIDAYDYLQSDQTIGWADNEGIQMGNVFTAEADGEIAEVSCQTNSVNASVTYQVYLLDSDAATPDDGTLAATASADYDYAGYHKIKLDEPVAVTKGQKYSVVVTSCFTDGSDVYYELSSAAGNSKEAVEEYNRKVLYRHRSDPLSWGKTAEETYADELLTYYSVGIVNEGESFVYMNELGQWADFGQVVPYLQKTEDYEDQDFDNFPIKAYLNYTDAGNAAANEDEVELEKNISKNLHYDDPAGPIYVLWLIEAAAAGLLITGIGFGIAYLVNKRRRKKDLARKEQLDKIQHLEEENAELKSRLGIQSDEQDGGEK